MSPVRLAALAFVVFALIGFGASASAYDNASDPRDAGGALDIKSVSDRTDSKFVTYRVETYSGFDNVKDFYLMRWGFDLHGQGHTTDMCIRAGQVGDGRLRAELYPDCGPAVWATADGTKPAPNVVEFTFLIRDLVQCCNVVPGRAFAYTVWAEDLSGHEDTAPDRGLVHQAGLPAPADDPGHTGSRSGTSAGAGSRSTGGAASIGDRGALGGTAGAASAAGTRHGGSAVSWAVVGVLLAIVFGIVAVLVKQRRLVWVDATTEASAAPDIEGDHTPERDERRAIAFDWGNDRRFGGDEDPQRDPAGQRAEW